MIDGKYFSAKISVTESPQKTPERQVFHHFPLRLSTCDVFQALLRQPCGKVDYVYLRHQKTEELPASNPE